MSILADIFMIAWIPFVLYQFSKQPSKQYAVMITFLIAWLFLPIKEYQFKGLPEYNKISATCIGIMIGAWAFDRNTFKSIRLNMMDLPMLLWCFSPLFSSLSNGLGLYDGLSCSMNRTVAWGMPYMVGKIYFSNFKSLNTLAMTLVIGGIIYIPLCLIEIRFSPQLHKWVYGFHQHDFGQTIRHGGFRPMVFMEHGLMVGMWMSTATLATLWLIYTKAGPAWLRHYRGIILSALLITFILCKSTGALILFLMATSALFLLKWLKLKVILWIIITLPLLYITLRTQGLWTGESLVKLAEKNINRERSQSLAFRLENEEMIVNRARQRIWLGWGDWGRWRVKNEEGEDITISDSLWVITLGRNGLLGVTCLVLIFILPLIMLLSKYSSFQLTQSEFSGALVLSTVLLLFAIDCLFNAMINPYFTMCAGSFSFLIKSFKEKQTFVPQLQFS